MQKSNSSSIQLRVAAATALALLTLNPALSKIGNETPANIEPAGVRVIEFQKDLHENEDLTCWGLRGTRAIDFDYPQGWTPKSSSTLLLKLAHSPALIPSMSYMTVEFNGHLLKYIQLNESNVNPTEIKIPLEAGDFKEHNQILFNYGQHYAEPCEDPFSASLRSDIGRDSKIVFNFQDHPLRLDLQTFPAPIVDSRAFDKQQIGFVAAENPSVETLKSMANIAFALGTKTNPSKIELINQAQPNAASIVFGTLTENPALAKIAADLPLKSQSGQFLDEAGKALPADVGILQLISNPGSSQKPLLVVSGNSPKGVIMASTALAHGDFTTILSGKAAIVRELSVNPVTTATVHHIPGLMPKETHFTLKELGYQTSTVRGTEPQPIVIDANTTPGITSLGTAQRMKIVYGYSGQTHPDNSSLEVRFNGVPVASYALPKVDKQTICKEDLMIPSDLIHQENRVEFVFHLMPRTIDKCQPLIDWHLWATLYDSTEFDFQRAYIEKLPDLSLLNSNGFPFSDESTAQVPAIVLPSKASASGLLGMVKLSYWLGECLPSVNEFTNVYYDKQLPEDVRTKNSLIVLSPGEKNQLEDSLGASLHLQHNDDLLKYLGIGLDKLTVQEVDSSGRLEECLSPWSPGKVVLACAGRTPEAFALAINGIVNPRLRSSLKGSLASISPSLTIKGAQATEMTSFGSIGTVSSLAVFLSDNIWAAPLLVLAIVIMGALILRTFIRRRSRTIKEDLK